MAERKEKNALPTQGGREKEILHWMGADGCQQALGYSPNCVHLRKDSLKEMSRHLWYSLGPFQV